MIKGLPLFPEQASTVAGQVDALYFFLVAVSGFFALLIAVLVVVFAIKYRRRAADAAPGAIHGSTALELTWSLIPFGIAMVMFFWGASVYFTIKYPPDDAIPIWVTGKQWMWKLQHQTGRREINELHVPVGRPVLLTMTSEDVIHSFYIPAFRVKQDVLPGRYTTLWFEATKTGRFHLFCAEYCGTEHSRMIGSIVVMDPAAYQQWLSASPAAVAAAPGGGDGAAAGGGGGESMAAKGEALFTQLGCNACHQAAPGALGPNLAGVFGSQVPLEDGTTVPADVNYLRQSILNPQGQLVKGYQPIMPTFKGQVSEEQLQQIIEYIKSLKATAGNGQGHS